MAFVDMSLLPYFFCQFSRYDDIPGAFSGLCGFHHPLLIFIQDQGLVYMDYIAIHVFHSQRAYFRSAHPITSQGNGDFKLASFYLCQYPLYIVLRGRVWLIFDFLRQGGINLKVRAKGSQNG